MDKTICKGCAFNGDAVCEKVGMSRFDLTKCPMGVKGYSPLYRMYYWYLRRKEPENFERMKN